MQPGPESRSRLGGSLGSDIRPFWCAGNLRVQVPPRDPEYNRQKHSQPRSSDNFTESFHRISDRGCRQRRPRRRARLRGGIGSRSPLQTAGRARDPDFLAFVANRLFDRGGAFVDSGLSQLRRLPIRQKRAASYSFPLNFRYDGHGRTGRKSHPNYFFCKFGCSLYYCLILSRSGAIQSMSRLMFVYLSGSEKGKTRIYKQDRVTLGTADSCDLKLVPNEGGELPEGVLAEV